MKLLFSIEWLERKIKSDPDIETDTSMKKVRDWKSERQRELVHEAREDRSVIAANILGSDRLLALLRKHHSIKEQRYGGKQSRCR